MGTPQHKRFRDRKGSWDLADIPSWGGDQAAGAVGIAGRAPTQ